MPQVCIFLTKSFISQDIWREKEGERVQVTEFDKYSNQIHQLLTTLSAMGII